MGNAGACCRCCEGSAAGVGKEVKDLHGFFGAGFCSFFPFTEDSVGEPVPVGGLLGEEAGVLKGEGLQVEGEGPVLFGECLQVFKGGSAGRAVGFFG